MSGTSVVARWRRNGGLALWAAACAAAPLVGRADANYVGGAGVGQWSTATNWSPVGVPVAGVNVNFVNADGLNRTLNYDYAGPAVTLGFLTVDQTGTGTNAVEMSGFALTTASSAVGVVRRGSFTQTGGVHMHGGLVVAYAAGSRGTYTLAGGELRQKQDTSAIIGWSGVGEFVHSGGVSSVRELYVGYDGGGNGTYRMSGSTQLEVTGREEIGRSHSVGGATGLFEQSGGTHSAPTMLIGGMDVGGGTYRLSGGSLTVSSSVSMLRNSRFEQTGGTARVESVLSIGGTTASPAVFYIAAGELVAQGVQVGDVSGSGTGMGRLDVSGGSVSVPANLGILKGGLLNLTGGTVTSPMFSNAGLVNAAGGAFTGAMGNTGTLRVGGGSTFGVTYALRGSVGGTAAGRLVIDAGGSVVANSVFQESLEMNGPTANPPMPGPVLTIRRKADGGETSVLRSLAVPADATGHPVGRVDLADNALVLDYVDAGASPVSGVRSLIGAAWAGGAWTGNGLGSSVAATRAGRGLGYAEASAVLGVSGGTFEGQKVDGTAVVVKYTVMGDATLNGGVDFDDLLALAKHYNATNAYWSDGDFNYDAVVNFDDLLILAKNYNGTLAGPVPGAPAGFDAAVAAAFAEVSVPEPGGLAGLVVAGVAGARARRRRVST